MSAKSGGLYHYLGNGNGFLVADSWYRDLDAPAEATNVSEFVTARTQQQAQEQEHQQQDDPVVNIVCDDNEEGSDSDLSSIDDSETLSHDFGDILGQLKTKVSENLKDKSV